MTVGKRLENLIVYEDLGEKTELMDKDLMEWKRIKYVNFIYDDEDTHRYS